MISLGTLKSFNSTDYRAEVQLAGSIAAYLDNIPVARNIAASQMVAGRHVIVAIPGGNPKDACVVAVWDAAAGGGGGGGASTFLDLTDTPSSYSKERFFPRINEAKNALEFVRGYEFGQIITAWQWELATFPLWTSDVTGSGVVLKEFGNLEVNTYATANSTAKARGYRYGWINWANQDFFQWYARVWQGASSPTGKTWLKLDGYTCADPTAIAIGWRWDGNALKGIVHNGTSLYVVDLSYTFEGSHDLFLDFVKGDKIYWYVDGQLKGSSANIPTTQRQEAVYLVFAATNGATSTWQRYAVWRHGWMAKDLG